MRTSVLGSSSTAWLGSLAAAVGPVAEKSNDAAQMNPPMGVMNAIRSAASPLSQSTQSPPFVRMPRPQLLPMRPAAMTPMGVSASPYTRRRRIGATGSWVAEPPGMPWGVPPSTRLSGASMRAFTATLAKGA